MSEYFSWGLFDVNLNVDKAIITEAKIYSDTLHPEIVEHLMASLKNVPYNKDAVETKLIEMGPREWKNEISDPSLLRMGNEGLFE